MDVINAEALIGRFGQWPSFHDAEVLGLRLDSGQRTDGIVRLQLAVHVFAVERRPSRDRLSFVKHTVVTLEFEGVEAVELDGFGPQNVLDELLLEDVALAAGRQVQVTLPSSNGLEESSVAGPLRSSPPRLTRQTGTPSTESEDGRGASENPGAPVRRCCRPGGLRRLGHGAELLNG